MMRKRIALLLVAFALAGLGAASAQAATSNFSGWSLPALLGNSINPANYTTSAAESHTWIKVSSNTTSSDFRVRNIKCADTTAWSSWVDYTGTWRNVDKIVWTSAPDGLCFRYQAGAYGLGGTTIGGSFKY